jgi:outer membrane beta-barrel protein
VIHFKKWPLLFSSLFISASSIAYSEEEPDSAVETVEIKKKLFPKSKRLELGADFGKILNQSYVSSYLLHFNGTFYISESSGISIEYAMAFNKDENARTCVENFYNDPYEQVESNCAATDGGAAGDFEGVDPKKATVGPAYPAIREIKNIISAAWVWVPVYGKQLLFMSGVNHFDVYTTIGGGVMMSDYYGQKKKASDDREYRGAFPAPPAGGGEPVGTPPGVGPDETNEYGKNGRPTPTATTSPLITLGIGQELHFGKMFNVKMEIRNYTLIGVPGFFEPYFAIWGGAALRF